ncbi:response regulator transcription factor [uncultured Pseudacidovorax sp.]|uniref:response regulator n=1 Tax=uncultured Pseudacidovorax sp. TaxID=679313 RepID=UPI0025D88A6B|nr:response regulator transcription factor [uncultured Pseudacidovorax sp.]
MPTLAAPSAPSVLHGPSHTGARPGRTLRIGVVDDHPVVRNGLRALFEAEDDLDMVWESDRARGLARELAAHRLDVLVLDLVIPGSNVLDEVVRLRMQAPDAGLVVYTGFAAEQYACTLVREGVRALVDKESDPHQVLHAVRAVARGERYLSPAMASLLLEHCVPADGRRDEPLSRRELQVLLKLAEGCDLQQAAESLCLSVKTVGGYRTRILAKLGLRSNGEMTLYAIRNQLMG